MATGTDTVMTPPSAIVAHGFCERNHKDDSIGGASVHHRRTQFHQLRRDVATLDGQSRSSRLPTGVESLDSALAGGLAMGRVHMLCGRPGHDGALTGFAVALLRRLLADGPANESATGPIVWCPAAAGSGSGMLYAAGLAALGLDPGRLLIVDSPSPGQRLAALEDILLTDGLAAVIVEYDGISQSADYWMRLARRAQLAAEASGVTGFLLGWPVAASGFETQWRVAPAAMDRANMNWTNMNGANMATNNTDRADQLWHLAQHPAQPWHPVWDVELTHARGGRPHAVRLQWDVAANRLHDRTATADTAASQCASQSASQPAMLPFETAMSHSETCQVPGRTVPRPAPRHVSGPVASQGVRPVTGAAPRLTGDRLAG